ncbi:MAG: HAMP domain-containing sensor histidine kinase [Myxococcota bacterium]
MTDRHTRPDHGIPGGGPSDEVQALERALLAEKAARRAAEEARDAAEKLSKTREEILEIVAHDLRNPLNLVKVGAGLLARAAKTGLDPEKVLDLTGSFQRACRRMERLIADLLDLGALEHGELRLVRGHAEATRLMDEVITEMRPMADDKGVELVADRPDRPTVVDCDKDRIVQVLENLIANAIKFTPKGKRVTVRLVAEGAEARFEVEDQGPGIPDDVLPHIFDPFYRAQQSTGRGLGLGLTIALGIVRAHRGAIWAESAHGRGATFVFTMPRREQRSDTVEIPVLRIPSPVAKK